MANDNTNDLSAECSSCHGSPDNPAPPQATNGDTTTDSVRVGAHQTHLHDSALRQAIGCDECHVVPATVDDAAHMDNDRATVTFGALATASGAGPIWNRDTATCSGAYCHGATLRGGTHPSPTWTKVDGTEAACGTCHGTPPPPPHPAQSDCSTCHSGTVSSGMNINVAGGLHINGIIDYVGGGNHPSGWASGDQHGVAANQNLGLCKTCHGADLTGGSAGISCYSCHAAGWDSSCTFCHGDRTSGRASPPVDTQRRSGTGLVSVGAHVSHFSPTLAPSIDCNQCHVVPTDIWAPAHINGSAEVTFGSLAKTGSASPTWTASTAKCANAYCHGKFTGGNTTNQPVWTTVNGSQKTCTSCHGDPPSTGHHNTHVNGEGIGCGTCHSGYSSSNVNASLHVNGTKNVSQASWNGTGCDPSCHGYETW